jgi:hypothetical protein
MKRLNLDKNQSRPPKQTVYEYEMEQRKKAIEAAKNHVDVKPIKYLLKR